MLANNACFVKRNIVVKHMTSKESLRNNEKIVALTHSAFKGWIMFKVMKSSMWYVDDNRWEDNNKL